MNREEHLDELRRRHAELDDRLASEEDRPLPDTIAIAQLKKEKLAIKDEMAQLASA